MSTTITRSATKRSATDETSTQPSTTSKQKARPQKRSKTETTEQSETNAATDNPSNSLKVTEETGDIFDAPHNAAIVHACNCEGSWGAGIAKAFNERYTKAYEEYASYCDDNTADQLFGTAALIPPVDAGEEDYEDEGFEDGDEQSEPSIPSHLIGCLFTSRNYGKKRDQPAFILEKTGPAMEDLLGQIQAWNVRHDKPERVREVRMCKINSGLFAVPWAQTKAVLESIDVSKYDVKAVKVIERAA